MKSCIMRESLLGLFFIQISSFADAFITPPPHPIAQPLCSLISPNTWRDRTNFIAIEATTEDSDNVEPSVEEIHESANAIFSMIDSDANGSISYSELQTHLMEVCGYTQDVVDAMYYALDADMDGSITREELQMGFVRYKNLREAPGMGMGRQGLKNEENIRQEAAAMFDSIDTDASGMIDNDELRGFLRSKGYGDNAIDNIYSTLDVDHDGQITREELSDAFVRYSALRYATGAESDDAQEFEL